jgi:hypothetical protein
MKLCDHDPYSIRGVIRSCLEDLLESDQEAFCAFTVYEVRKAFRDGTDLPVRTPSKD